MHEYTVVHVRPGRSGPASTNIRIEKVRASSPKAAMHRFCGRRMTPEEIAKMPAPKRG